MRRFYFRSGERAGDSVRLSGSEAHHLSVVIRAKIGDRVVLFNERGDEFYATVVKIGKGKADLSIEEKVAAAGACTVSIDMAVAMAKGRAMERILAGATELGVRGITIVPSSRSVPHLDGEAVPGRLARWEKIVLSAAKQSGRSSSPVVEYLQRWAELPGRTSRYDRTFITRECTAPKMLCIGQSETVLVIVGPEGGFTGKEEAALLEGGALPLGLGPFTLRCETAALAAVTLLVNAVLTRAPSSIKGGLEER